MATPSLTLTPAALRDYQRLLRGQPEPGLVSWDSAELGALLARAVYYRPHPESSELEWWREVGGARLRYLVRRSDGAVLRVLSRHGPPKRVRTVCVTDEETGAELDLPVTETWTSREAERVAYRLSLGGWVDARVKGPRRVVIIGRYSRCPQWLADEQGWPARK